MRAYYDYTYYRPRHKRYSYMTGNDVEYTYGTSGNETGRLVHIVDGSGSYECFYDALGNVTEDIRTIALPGSDEVYRFKTQYTYDSWGRMDQMIYPDGEVVSYKYIWGGDLFAMDGDKNGALQSYIRGIHYNKFGQRDSVQYGNGTRVHYTYDALHRLYHLTSFQLGGAVMQNIKYTFDSVNNIKRIKDSVLAIGTLGGGYDNTFKYDGLHRLGGSQGDNTLGHYRYTMDYTPSGRITSKYIETPSGSLTGSVNMFYGYCNDQKPHTVRRIFDEKNERHFDLRWDDAGNLGQISIGNEDAKFETGRFLFWTEDCYGCEHRLCLSNVVSNRMHAAVDEKYSSYYVYDHSGERRVKLTGTNDLLDVNADYMYTASVLKEPTIYPSAYMVMSNRGYTKHYYAGAERVAARIGGGGLKVIDQEHGLSDKSGSVFKQSLEQINERILENNDINCIANGLSSNDKLTIDMNEVPERLQAELITDYDEFRQMIADAQSIHHNEPDVYFYHSDHLGSASWITDNGGLAVQHLQYLPYGERYVDQRTAGYNERFTFTCKERDEETGYGYFGARYMDHELMTMWLSVDPMADKYPSISPYAYCAWNPMKLVDPDGNEVAPVYDKKGNFLGTDDQGIQGKAIVMDKENFKQGMNHSYALKRNKGAQGLEGNDAHSKLKKHYAGLKKRPDWDGVVTRKEGIVWAKDHPGALNHPTPDNTLYINAAMLDFGNITTSDFENGVGKSSAIQTLNPGNFIKGLRKGEVQNTVYALGRVELFLLNESGDVRVVNNEATDYDWNTGGGRIRNALIKCERAMNGLSDNHGFKTYYYGTGKVKK